jgi:hypothetical protein
MLENEINTLVCMVRLGFVSICDAEDLNQWSGIGAHVLASLRSLRIDVKVFSQLSQKIKYLLPPAKLLARLRRVQCFFGSLSARASFLCAANSRAIRCNPVDAIFATAVYASKRAAHGAYKLTDPSKVYVLPFVASFAVQHSAADG